MMNGNYITAMIALIVLLFVLLVCMTVALALITKLRTRVDDLEANLDAKPTQNTDANHQPRPEMPLSPVRPFSPTRPIADYVSPRCHQGQIRSKRDRRSLESFRWVPFEGASQHQNAYFNKIEDFKSTYSVQFNTLQRSKASIDLI